MFFYIKLHGTSGFATTLVVVPGHCDKNVSLRKFSISDANERQNQVLLGCNTIHVIFLLTVQ